MTTCSEFLCRVNDAGVPHSRKFNSQYDEALFKDVAPDDICKTFWLLDTLTINYTFKINDVTVYRNIHAVANRAPVDRLIIPPVIYQSESDDFTKSDYYMLLDFSEIFLDKDNEKYGIKMLFEEIESNSLFEIGFFERPGLANIATTTEFFGKTQNVYLGYNTKYVSSAEIHDFVITPTYYDVVNYQ